MLNNNDWNSISVSLRKMNEITRWVEFGDEKVSVSTHLSNKAWNVAMLVLVRYERHNPYLFWSQWFESVEAARKELEDYLSRHERRWR